MGLMPMPTSTEVSRFGAPMASSCACHVRPAPSLPKRIFRKSFGNSRSRKSSTFCASGEPATYSIPA